MEGNLTAYLKRDFRDRKYRSWNAFCDWGKRSKFPKKSPKYTARVRTTQIHLNTFDQHIFSTTVLSTTLFAKLQITRKTEAKISMKYWMFLQK